MIRAVIFDLDNCLAAADEPGRELLAPTFDAIRRANHGTLSEKALERAFEDCWRHSLDSVAKEYGFSEAMLAAGWAENARAEVTEPMRGYADFAEVRELPTKRFLVTSGFRRLQESKVRALDARALFDDIYIDAIDEPDRKGKEAIFRDILRTYALDEQEVLVVGDDAESEIAAGNRMGVPTVQIMRPGVTRTPHATHHIASIRDLHQLALQHAWCGGA